MAYKCIPCKENHYCIRGIRYDCPIEKPVTIGGSKGAESDCMTCVDREGEAKPVYADYMGKYGDCISCVEQDLTKPIWNGKECISCETVDVTKPNWNGSECAVCPSATKWETSKKECVSILSTVCTEDEDCVYKINHDGGILYLMESVGNDVYGSVAPKSAEEETEEFLVTYGIQKVSGYWPDKWAGAMKYCQDKGYRLPTMQELISISQALYGEEYFGECEDECGTSSVKSNCCVYDNLSVVDQGLLNFLGNASSGENVTDVISLWSNAETNFHLAKVRNFSNTSASFSYYYGDGWYRSSGAQNAVCVR